MPVTINNSEFVDGSWSDVDKPALGRKLEEAGSNAAVRETYLFVGDIEKRSTWKFPHHVLQGDVLKPHRSGIFAAAQRLVSSGATATDIPKKAAARHLVKHYRAMGEEVPESLQELTKYLCLEEALKELQMLETLGAEIPEELQIEMDLIPAAGFEIIHPDLEKIQAAIDRMVDDLEEKSVDKKSLLADHIKMKSENSEGIRATLAADGVSVSCTKAVNFTNKGKKTPEDFFPTDEELRIINKDAPIEVKKEDGFVFVAQALDGKVDRQKEKASKKARESGARLFPGKAFLLNHRWDTDHQKGIIIDGLETGGKLLLKVFIPNEPENRYILNNIFKGVFRFVSVGFTTRIENLTCSSCRGKRSIYDLECPHRPGMVDERGEETIVTIEDIDDAYELSLVAVPAQPEAGIRRNLSVTKSNNPAGSDEDTEDYSPLEEEDKIKILSHSSINSEKSVNPLQTENADTIISDSKDVGEPNVSKELPTEEEKKDIAPAQPAEDPATSDPSPEAPGQEQSQDPEPAQEPAEEPQETEKGISEDAVKSMIGEVVDESAKALEQLSESLKTLSESLEEKISTLKETQKQIQEKLDLVSEVLEHALKSSFEEEERVKAAQSAQQQQQQAAPEKKDYVADAYLALIGGEQ